MCDIFKKVIKYDNLISHFTKRNTIFEILKCQYFLPKYNIQEIPYKLDGSNKAAFPIVCFCDSGVDIIKHIGKYGNFGLGLCKKWAIKNKLNPVFYFNSNSFVTENFKKVVENFSVLYPYRKATLNDWYKLLYIIAFTKEYENYLEKEFYYEEREWRYFPIKSDGSIGVLTKIMYDNIKLRENENSKIKDNNLFLTFEICDLEKIFIPEFEDLGKFKNEIATKLNTSKKEEIEYLVNKVEVY
jgi:hypothetical protein